MGTLQRYDGNDHPELLVRQARSCCYSTKSMINNSINITFTVFKDTYKSKLQLLRYCSEKGCGDLLRNFRMLCYGAEINDIKELKQYLFQSIQSHYYLDRDDYNK
ncbi:5419_t:CDS:2, partial [Funneliformis caledonium]